MSWLWILAITVVLGILFILYRKRQDEEGGLFLKLAGFSFLGAFTFSINDWKLPAGFVICLLMLRRSRTNQSVKQLAALIGLLLYISQFIVPAVENYWFERPRTIAVETNARYNDVFSQLGSILEKELQIRRMRLDRFEANFRDDGVLEHFRLEAVEGNNGTYIYYSVRMNDDHTKLIVDRHRINGEWLQFDRSIPVNQLLEKLSLFDLQQLWGVASLEKFSYYSLDASDGSYVNYGVKDAEKYKIAGNHQMSELSNEQLPVRGIWIAVCGSELLGDHIYSKCDHRVDLLFE